MDEKDFVRIQHMLQAAKIISSFIEGRERQNLDTDRLLLSGVLRELEVLGEAAGRISKSTRDLHPGIPWNQMIGMRNRLIHAYFDINHDIVWKTAKEFVPMLEFHLKNIISS